MKERMSIKGKVTATLFDENGNVKRLPPNCWRILLNFFLNLLFLPLIPGREMIFVNHNIVTDHGDALIADAMSDSQARTKVDNTNGVIGVGTGFAAETKAVTALVTQAGTDKAMEATYPKIKGAFNSADDNVTQYRSIFAPGESTATGIDEVALGNGTDLLAYAGLTSFDKEAPDTLQMDWELTYLGA